MVFKLNDENDDEKERDSYNYQYSIYFFVKFGVTNKNLGL